MGIVEPIIDFRQDIIILRRKVLFIHQCQYNFEVTSSRRHEPTAPILVELTFGEQPRVHQADAEGGATRRLGPHRGDVENAAHVVAVGGREGARHHVDAADGHDVDDAEAAAVDVFEVERLVELEPVEHDEHFFVLAAAHGELGGKVVPRDAGESLDGAVNVLSELGQRVNVLLRQRLARRRVLVHDGKAAGGDDDLLKGKRSSGQGDVEEGALITGHGDVEDNRLVADMRCFYSVAAGRHTDDGVAAVLTRDGTERFVDDTHDGVGQGFTAV